LTKTVNVDPLRDEIDRATLLTATAYSLYISYYVMEPPLDAASHQGGS